MFEQMGKAALRVGFEHRADVHADADRNLAWGDAIVADGIADAIGQDAELPCGRSEEHTSELQSLMRISYAVFCLQKTTHSTEQQAHANQHKNIMRAENN